MSLKIFHVIFITLAVLLAVFCAIWGFSQQAAPAFSYTSAAVALGLVVYGIWFVKKSKGIIV